MPTKSSATRALALGALTSVLVLASTSHAQVTSRPPNLQPLPASNFSLVNNANGLWLRFAATSWNSGTGALQVEAGPVDTGSGKQMVNQRVFLSDGSSFLHFAGYFEFHAEHDHFHFDDYALYTLQPLNAPGGSQRTGRKTTFCLMDTTRINLSLPGAPQGAVFATCGRVLQGISVGWGDTYGAHLAGQEIDFSDNADGIYALKIEIDPNKVLVESNKNDNVSCVLLDIRKPASVTVLDSSGSCSAVQSVAPNSAKTGTSVQVTISGFGFTPGMAISFEGGNGPRPVASNIVLASDTETVDTITATVTVPFKKQAGKRPIWDLRVGNSVLRDAFRVTQ